MSTPSRAFMKPTRSSKTKKLWVWPDRVSMKPPAFAQHSEYDFRGFIHWDLDTTQRPPPFGLQGVLSPTDTTADMGGFQCIPSFHRNLEAWLDALPPGSHPRFPDLAHLPAGMQVTPNPTHAGDLVIWDSRLAHGNGHNRSDRPRLAQYVGLFPAEEDNNAARQERIALWEQRLPPVGDAWPGDPRGWMQTHAQPAALNPLGRKLLGLDLWDE